MAVHSKNAADMGPGDWRSQLGSRGRRIIIKFIMDSLIEITHAQSLEDLINLRMIVGRFEDNLYRTATDRDDYIKKISVKLVDLETRSEARARARQAASPSPASPPVHLPREGETEGSNSNSQGQNVSHGEKRKHPELDASDESSEPDGGAVQPRRCKRHMLMGVVICDSSTHPEEE